MIRIFDLFFSFSGLLILSPIFFILYLAGLFDTGSPLFFQDRVGQHKKTFKLIKFRTMSIGTAQVGTHLTNSKNITSLGAFLRKTKLDELPQLINVIRGEMSIVGPRPGLTTQKKLLHERLKRNIYDSKPGITGLAQINKIDMSTPKKLARYDQLMKKQLNILLYLKIIILTATGQGTGDRIKQ